MELGANSSTKPPTGKKMKSRAPPPPPVPQPAPRRIYRDAVPDGDGGPSGESKENILRSVVELHITLPDGYQTTCSVDGSKALMDLLVDLCGRYHLNPAHHTLELLSPEAQHISFKPNALLGTLDVSCAIIKERVTEEKVIRKPAPKAPEKTVRLVVNYHRSQKALVRVSPFVPLRTLVPVICSKCEFDPAHVLLFKDRVSNKELDLNQSLTELGIRELYVLDQSLAESLRSSSQSVGCAEKSSLLGLFKFSRRKEKVRLEEDQSSEDMDDHEDNVCENTDSSTKGMSTLGSVSYVEARPSTLGQSQSVVNISRMSPKVDLKKRRAPAPPAPPPGLTQSTTLALQSNPGSPRSESQQKKRKAPPPPPVSASSTPAPNPQTPPLRALAPAPVPAPRSSVPANDSTSELSHSTEDSGPPGSVCSSSSSDVAVGSSTSSLADEPMQEHANELACSTTPEPEPEPEPEPTPSTTPDIVASTTSEETDSALNLKMEEVENNRHSAIAWTRSVHKCVSEQTGDSQEVETVSVGSSSSYADQGYAPSEGMADDSGRVSSPSDLTLPTSPEDTFSLNCSPVLLPNQPKDCSSSSDSDEGCATWGSRRSGDSHRGRQADKRGYIYEEDHDLTAQFHQTLADLDADLADVNHSDAGSVCVDDEIPVSVVDVDVPVTAIDEVLDDDRLSMNGYETDLSRGTQSFNRQNIYNSNSLPSGDMQNKNNNARMAESQCQASVGQIQTVQRREIPRTNGEEKKETAAVAVSSEIKAKVEPEKPKVQRQDSFPERSQSPLSHPPVRSPQRVSESHVVSVSSARSQSMETFVERVSSPTRGPQIQSKITQNPVSRFGMKTFTVVPPKPPASRTEKQAGSLILGAIKIDEQGNMVKQREVPVADQKHEEPAQDSVTAEAPLLGKAKAFWTSTEKQDTLTVSREQIVKTREVEVSKPPTMIAPAIDATVSPLKTRSEETARNIIEVTSDPVPEAEIKASSPEPVRNPVAVLNTTEQKRDFTFLKPTRRTSSQYVASAISKYAMKPTARAGAIRETPESSIQIQKPLASPGLKHEVRSTHVVSEYKETQTTTTATTTRVSQLKESTSVHSLDGPKRSSSFPSQPAKSEVKLVGNANKGAIYGGTPSKSLDLQPSYTKFQTTAQKSTKTGATTTSPSFSPPPKKTPEESSPVRSPTEVIYPPIAKKPDVPSQGVLPEPDQTAALFGPVKKFKPVVFKSVEKETSLHSSLMEAIQSGEGKERLRRVSDPRTKRALEKLSHTEAESEHSALLSAIRAQHNSTRLKKTKSEAAKELEHFRRKEESRSTQSQSSPAAAAPPAFAPPPPPSAPPPSTSTLSKSTLMQPAGENLEQAREAMLEAIRSGSAAGRLKKVPVTINTRKVNRRLGIVQPGP
ncbi:protein cordon-bleu isoform X1 [Chanos chanos]|uniref:Protein cordon-bleu isoform X1 n=2 Tax=Chanos chanos TaxID=29144 RepID=A0A6J2W1D0_CHACN|nr:protein cordon-bleu isoform X1 [Chanos chanos]